MSITSPPPPAPQSSGRGCLFYGGIIAAVLLLLALLTGYAGYRYVRHLVNEYTDTKPTEFPAVQLSGMEITNLQDRIRDFEIGTKQSKPVAPLVLTADEINALLPRKGASNSLGPIRLYFTFNDNRVQAQLSMPADRFGLPFLQGRYFNGSGDFEVALSDGQLTMNVKSVLVKGKPLPEQFMGPIRAQNFAEIWRTNDTESAATLARLKEIRIEDGKLFVVPRTNEVESGK